MGYGRGFVDGSGGHIVANERELHFDARMPTQASAPLAFGGELPA